MLVRVRITGDAQYFWDIRKAAEEHWHIKVGLTVRYVFINLWITCEAHVV